MQRKLVELLSSYTGHLVALSGLLTAVVGILGKVNSLFENNVEVVLTGAVLCAWGMALFVRHSIKETLPGGIKIYRYPKLREQRWVVVLCKRLLTLGIIVLIWLLSCALKLWPEKCQGPSGRPYLVVTQFTNGRSAFSRRLYIELENRLPDNTVGLSAYDGFVDPMCDQQEVLKQIHASQCSSNGCIIQGAHNVEDAEFYGKIRVQNLPGLTRDIPIVNPDTLSFSIESRATFVADFVVGLLKYRQGAFDGASSNLYAVIDSCSASQGASLLAWCHTLLGNMDMYEGRPEEAVASFERALALDSTNSVARGNRAIALDAVADEAPQGDTIATPDVAPEKEVAVHAVRVKAPVDSLPPQPLMDSMPAAADSSLEAPVPTTPCGYVYDTLPTNQHFQRGDAFYLGEAGQLCMQVRKELLQFLTSNPATKVTLDVQCPTRPEDAGGSLEALANRALLQSQKLHNWLATRGIDPSRIGMSSGVQEGDFKGSRQPVRVIITKK